MDQERIEEAVKKFRKGVGLTNEDLQILYVHYLNLVDALEIEGEEVKIIWRHFFDSMNDIKYMINARKAR